ncbi:ATP-grasp domain-containing protein [Thermoflavimicrobium daqui]|jgi:biotin carboxylase|uniref:Arginase n=1 Tax=Thermoflavimicrobium daqui TaxID=2137476 RepID=A0A364K127_9BACL|nr:ATP-grasp domain-containing protein [Thermoflavimicrobium daqui]RAL21399.1 arginase [Thermoflavimicrobium daqui]
MTKKLMFVEANTTGTGILAIGKAQELGYEAIFLTQKASRYDGLSSFKCRVIETDTNSMDALKLCISKENINEIAGILTTSDYYLETVAELVQLFGLRGNSPQTIAICRNKALFREKLRIEKLLQPKFKTIRSIDDLDAVRGSVSLPCVVKPADDSGSNNVRFCSSWEEVELLTSKILEKKLNARGQKTVQTVLLEEYIEGSEYSVEMFSWEGNSYCIGITEKRLTGFPYFVESGHIFPTQLPADVQQEIISTVKRALQMVDLQFGASHSEVKWTPNGCLIIEVNARLAGGMIPELIRYSTGMDLLKYQILCAAGVAPEWDANIRHRFAGIQFLTAKESGRLNCVDNMEEVKRLPGIQELVVKAQIGQVVQPPENFSHRLGNIIACGDTYKETVECLEKAAKMISLKIK